MSGLTLAFLFNIARTTLLGWETNLHGLKAMEKWHDPAGISITVACFFCLWAMAVLMRRYGKAESRNPKGEG